MGYKKCKHFRIEELVPEDLYKDIKALPLHPSMVDKILWSLFDEEILDAIDWIKEQYSPDHPVSINTWYWSGDREWSGGRTTDSEYYREGSMHSVFNAFDLIFQNITSEEIRQDLFKRHDVPFRRVENKVSWLHVDNKPTDYPLGVVYGFNP